MGSEPTPDAATGAGRGHHLQASHRGTCCCSDGASA